MDTICKNKVFLTFSIKTHASNSPDVDHLHWMQTLRDAHMAIEANLLWECRASGKPKPKYRWLKNGSALATEVRRTDIVLTLVCCSGLWDPLSLFIKRKMTP